MAKAESPKVKAALSALDAAVVRARFARPGCRMPYYRLVPKNAYANVLFRKQIIQRGYDDPGFALAVHDMCSRDILFWINTFGWTFDPRPVRGTEMPFGECRSIPFITWKIQDAYILELQASVGNNDFLNEKSRCVGASWGGLYVLHWFWHFTQMARFGLASRNDEYVDALGNPKSLFWKLDFIDRMMPEWMLPRGRVDDLDYRGRKLGHLENLKNGSVHNGEAATENLFAGDRLTAAFMDEFSRFPVRLAFQALTATRDATPCRIFNGTSTGPGCAYHHVVTRTNCKRMRIHWSSCPLHRRGLYQKGNNRELRIVDTKYWIERCRRKGIVATPDTINDLAPETYDFDNQPFVDDDDFKYRSPWFDKELGRCANKSEALQELEIRYDAAKAPYFDPVELEWHRKEYALKNPVIVRGELDHTSTGQASEFLVRKNGAWRLWFPLAANSRPPNHTDYVIGADVASGTKRGEDQRGYSNSVLSVASRSGRRLVAQYATSGMRPDLFAELAIAACHFFRGPNGPARLIWEANGPAGGTFRDRVRDLRYFNVYVRQNLTKLARKSMREMGWWSDDHTKPILLGQFRRSIARGGDFICPSLETLDECEQYIHGGGGSIEHMGATHEIDESQARENHGDRVIATALCIWELNSQKIDAGSREVSPNTMESRDREAEEAATIGAAGQLWNYEEHGREPALW